MTVPSYTTDLALLATGSDAESGSWVELATPYADGAAPGIDPENFIQGSNSQSQAMGNKFAVGKSIAFDAGSDLSASFAAGDVVMTWVFFGAPTNLYDYATTGGHRFGIAADTVGVPSTSLDMWFISGDDRPPNPYGGWWNVAIDPTHPPDAVTGGGNGGVYWYFGSILEGMRAKIAKGTPHAVDVMRYGRGELIIEFGEAADYGTFEGLSTENDYNDVTNGYNRWGLFQSVAGGYLWKGLMSFGNATNPCDFRDENRNIVIDDTPKVYADFNRIEIKNAGSRVDWTSIGISSAGTVAKGNFECIDDANVTIAACTFTDMGQFTFKSNSYIDSSTFRGCGEITTNSCYLDGCIFDNCISGTSVIVDEIDNVTLCTFKSDGSNHAVEATVAGDYNWQNYLIGYATSDGSTGNEPFYNNSGGHINLTALTGYSYPYVRNGTSATTTVIIPQVILTISAPVSLVGAEIRIYDYESAPPDFGTELDGVESHDSATFEYNGAAANLIYIQIMLAGYKEFGQQYTMPAADAGFYAGLQIETNA